MKRIDYETIIIIVALIVAGQMAINHIEGWGWLVFIAFMVLIG